MKIVIITYEEKYANRESLVFADKLYETALKYCDSVVWEYVIPNNEQNKLDIFGRLKKEKADLIITIDLAGFSFTTTMGDLVYNILDSHKAHFVLGKMDKEKLDSAFKHRLNFSDIVYLTKESSIKEYSNRYPDICLWECISDSLSVDEIFRKVIKDFGYENIIF